MQEMWLMFTSHPKSMKAAVDQACSRHAVNKHKRNSRYPANVAIVTTPPLQKNVRKKNAQISKVQLGNEPRWISSPPILLGFIQLTPIINLFHAQYIISSSYKKLKCSISISLDIKGF